MSAGQVIKGMLLGWFLTGIIAFGLFLIPGVDFLSQILGGTIQDFDQFLIIVFQNIPGAPDLSALGAVIASFLELVLFGVYPLSWILAYRPEDWLSTVLMIVPWIGAGFLTGLACATNPKDAIKIGIGLIIGNCIWALIFNLGIPFGLANLPMIPGEISSVISGVLTGIAEGLTDMPPAVSAILVQVEGGAFFIGSGILAGLMKEGRE